MATNVVLAGSMEGGEVMLSVGGKSAYVICGQRTRYINKLEVKELAVLNRSTNNGIITYGSSVAPISKSEIMVEIHWKDGTSSLVKVDNTVHQAMIVGMYNDVTQTQQAQTAQKDTKTRNANATFGYILFFVCTAIYLFAEFAK